LKPADANVCTARERGLHNIADKKTCDMFAFWRPSCSRPCCQTAALSRSFACACTTRMAAFPS